MPQGNYDHPSYIVRQQISLGSNAAGANSTIGRLSFVSDMVLRKVSFTPIVAGTTATHAPIVRAGTAGTTALGTVTLGTTAALTQVVSADLNVKIPAGGVLNIITGPDATGTFIATCEMNIAPDTGTWT